MVVAIDIADRNLPGPDHPASLEPNELAASEANTVAVVRRSLVAARDIPAGTTLTEELIAIKRPGAKLSPSILEASIDRAVSLVLSSEFRKGLAGLKNPYGDGYVGERVVAYLEGFVPFKDTLRKTFWDSPDVQAAFAEWRRQHG